MIRENNGDWNIWSTHVRSELERLNNNLEEIVKRLNAIDKDLAIVTNELKLKSGLWGMAGGFIVAIPFLVAVWSIMKD